MNRWPFSIRRYRECARSGFTMPELLMVLAIGGLVLGTMTDVLLQSHKIWRDHFCQFYLAQQGRLARERILRGISQAEGLRSASSSSMQVADSADSGSITFMLPSVSNTYFSVWQHPDISSYSAGAKPDRLYCFTGTGTSTGGIPTGGFSSDARRALANESMQCKLEHAAFDQRVVSCDYSLTFGKSGRTFTNRYRIATYVVND